MRSTQGQYAYPCLACSMCLHLSCLLYPSNLKGTSLCLQLLSAARLGEQVYKGHHSYDLMRNLQLGILFSIAKSGRLSPLGAKRSLDPSDFSMQVGAHGHLWLVEHVRQGWGRVKRSWKRRCSHHARAAWTPATSACR